MTDLPRSFLTSRPCVKHRWPVSSAVVLAVAAWALSPAPASADSVIDAAIKPYFVLGGLVTALVFLAVGLLILWPAIRKRRLAAEAMQWPMTEGRVVSTDILKKVFKSQDSDFDYFVPHVRYQYTTDGVRREGDLIRIGLDEMGYPLEKQAREHIARYPLGATIAVRYDPNAPEHAVLEAGHTGVARKILAGFIFLGLGIAAIAFAIWSASLPTR